MNGKPKPLEHDQVKEIKAELLQMRDKINDMISRLDSFSEERTTNKNFESRETVVRKDVPVNQGNSLSRHNLNVMFFHFKNLKLTIVTVNNCVLHLGCLVNKSFLMIFFSAMTLLYHILFLC